jgi:hypothetical protein
MSSCASFGTALTSSNKPLPGPTYRGRQRRNNGWARRRRRIDDTEKDGSQLSSGIDR